MGWVGERREVHAGVSNGIWEVPPADFFCFSFFLQFFFIISFMYELGDMFSHVLRDF